LRQLALPLAALALGTAGVIAGSTAGAGAAPKPTLEVQSCVFAHTKKVPYLAENLVAGVPYAVKLGGRTLRSGKVREDGTVGGSIRAPALGSLGERISTLSVATKTTKVRKRITTSRFGVTISPRVTGHSPSDYFRFRLFRFLRGGSLYVHYVKPNGRLRLTIRLGRPTGECGSLTTGRRQLFPFNGRLARGTWRFQFDKHRRYSRDAKAPKVRLKVPIL
jgi:hypothetical protein